MNPLIKTFGIHALIGVLTLSSLGIVYAAWNDDVTSSDTLTTDRWNDLVTQVEGIGGGSGKFINGTDTNDAVYTTGNVGIGTNDPVRKLHIHDTNTGASNNVQIAITNGDTGSTNSDGFVVQVTNNEDAAIWNRENTNILFATNSTERMRIDNSGNIGIGTTSPVGKLEVKGNASPYILGATQDDESVYGLRVANTTSDTSNSDGFLIKVTNSAVSQMHSRSAGSDGEISFHTGDAERVRIDNAGRIGIGSSNPLAKLHINESGYDTAMIYFSSTSSAGDIGVDNGTFRIRSMNSEPIVFFPGDAGERMRINDNGNVGIGTTSPSTKLHVAGTITETSDERLKEDITNLEGSLSKILKLNGVKYNWKDREKFNAKVNIGVLAQNIEEVFPELVNTDGEGYKSVEYGHLVAPLIEAVKELKAENEAMREEYRSEILRLENIIDADIKNK